ncbi:MAG: hypothetical protein JSW38_13495 [Dehalococcoidia bacterium]|nr:MAG: hypothetical protein JSW38_13495 [Dehalococcoidia bacterium]
MDEEKFDLRSLRQEIKRREMRWRAGRTKFTELPVGEFRRYLGLRLPDERSRYIMRRRIMRARRPFRYPSAIDWRNHNNQDWTTPIRDQGGCGSCVAFGVVATMEAQWNILRNDTTIDLDLSEAHLFFCGGSCGCSFGWWIPPALTYASDHGVSTETCFPYEDHDMACNLCEDWTAEAHRVEGWREIASVAERKSILSEHGPLVAAMDVYEDFRAYTGGVYQHTSGDKLGGHCISIVGYNDHQGCWICKNSWGTDWGETGGLSTERGWFRIAYGECGIDTDHPSYVIDDMIEGGIKNGEDQGTTPCCLSAIAKGTPYEQDLILLSQFRDTHLLESATAKKYIDLYYNYTEAIVEVLRADKRSKELAFSLLDTVINAIRATATSEEFRFTEENIDCAMELLRRVTRYAPRELRKELMTYQEELNEIFAMGRGKKLTDFTETVQKYSSKRRSEDRSRE